MSAGILAVSGLPGAEADERLEAAHAAVSWRGPISQTHELGEWTVWVSGSALLSESRGVLVALHPSPACNAPDDIAEASAQLGVRALMSIHPDHAALVVDGRNGVGHLSRDFMGTRPLFWGVDGSAVAVASEPVAVQLLLGHGPRENTAAVDAYLGRRRIEISETFHHGVRCVPPDTVLTLSTPVVERVRPFSPAPAVRDEVALERTRFALESAILSRTSAKDTTACNASGGVDSGVIAAATANAGRAAMFLTHRVLGLEDDETGRAAQVATQHDVPHEVVFVEPVDIVERLLPTIRATGPVHPTAWLSGATVERAAQLGADAVLVGHLGDHWLTMAGGSLAQASRDRQVRTAMRFASEYRRASGTSVLRTAGSCVKHAARGLLIGSYADHCREAFRSDSWVQLTLSSLERFGALHGVRVEFPFADRHFVETALGATASQRNAPGAPKRLLREAFAGVLPASYVNDPIKANFFTVPAMAFDGELDGYEAYQRIRELQISAWRNDLHEMRRRL